MDMSDTVYSKIECEKLHIKFCKRVLGVHQKSTNFAVGHMSVYGHVRHTKNIIWTEASEVHMTRSDMNYLLYYTFHLK
jgi:hypothetical protein